MNIRKYNPEKDKKSVERIFKEVGWVNNEKEEKALNAFIKGCDTLVAEVKGEAEVAVASIPGSICYLDQEIKTNVIGAVTVSRTARKMGLASKVTAQAVKNAVLNGEKLSTLGMFEQGFYNRLGFGTGVYEHIISFDPGDLLVDKEVISPERITIDDWEKIHQGRINRLRNHGSCNILSADITRGEMLWSENGFGLGYYNPTGELSHHIWFNNTNGEHGPYQISWIVYQNKEQFYDLMALLKSLGDQVNAVRMIEPPGIQMQDLIKQPMKTRRIREKSKYKGENRAIAFWQIRINDLNGCLAATHLSENIKFNLILNDPIEKYLANEGEWSGLSGQYIVELGSSSHAEKGYNDSLLTLTASIGAFSRLWFGVLPATSLAVTDELTGPQELLEELDRIMCLPVPRPDWEF
ncbi:MAG: GNAT family N-acetyltransferase [bacterium]